MGHHFVQETLYTHSFQSPAPTSEPKGLVVNEASLSLGPQLPCESSSDLGVLIFLGNALKKGSPVHPHCSRLCKEELKIPWGGGWLNFPWQQRAIPASNGDWGMWKLWECSTPGYTGDTPGLQWEFIIGDKRSCR